MTTRIVECTVWTKHFDRAGIIVQSKNSWKRYIIKWRHKIIWLCTHSTIRISWVILSAPRDSLRFWTTEVTQLSTLSPRPIQEEVRDKVMLISFRVPMVWVKISRLKKWKSHKRYKRRNKSEIRAHTRVSTPWRTYIPCRAKEYNCFQCSCSHLCCPGSSECLVSVYFFVRYEIYYGD